MSITLVMDATHTNASKIPANVLAALYTTGSPDIRATTADFNAHPNAVRIVQDHGSDVTADVIDSETGAANAIDVANWIPKARNSFMVGARPGQRWPGVYTNLNGLTPIANEFVARKIINVPLWIARPGLAETNAISLIANASGPWPIVGIQFRFENVDDVSVFSTEWLNHRAKMATTDPAIPPGQWKNRLEWKWNQVAVLGTGMDNRFHGFIFNQPANHWDKVM